jgi:hypothetical protein
MPIAITVMILLDAQIKRATKIRWRSPPTAQILHRATGSLVGTKEAHS